LKVRIKFNKKVGFFKNKHCLSKNVSLALIGYVSEGYCIPGLPDLVDIKNMMTLKGIVGYDRDNSGFFYKIRKANREDFEKYSHTTRTSYYLLPDILLDHDECNFPILGGCRFEGRKTNYIIDILNNYGFEVDGRKIKKVSNPPFMSSFVFSKCSVGSYVFAKIMQNRFNNNLNIEMPNDLEKMKPEIKQFKSSIEYAILGSKFFAPNDFIVPYSYDCLCKALEVENDIFDFQSKLGVIDDYYMHTDLIPIDMARTKKNKTYHDYDFFQRWENYAEEYKKLGLEVKGSECGKIECCPCSPQSNVVEVKCPDLRSAFGCIVLAAKNNIELILDDFEILMRGYENIIENIEELGGEIIVF